MFSLAATAAGMKTNEPAHLDKSRFMCVHLDAFASNRTPVIPLQDEHDAICIEHAEGMLYSMCGSPRTQCSGSVKIPPFSLKPYLLIGIGGGILQKSCQLIWIMEDTPTDPY